MDIILTSPLTNTKYCTRDELKLMCQHLNISYKNNENKQQLKEKLKHYNFPIRTQIKCCQHIYYIETNFKYKSFGKSYDDMYREVYYYTYKTNSYQYFRYCKSNNIWEYNNKPCKYLLLIENLNRLRNIMYYIELLYIFMNFYNQEYFIKDIFYYIFTVNIKFYGLSPQIYKII